MNYIDITQQKIIDAENKHYLGIIDDIFIRIDSITNPFVKACFDNYINPYLDIIVKGTPEQLLQCHNRIKPYLIPLVKKNIHEVFKYKGWFDQKKKTKYDAYDLATNVDIPTCTYCNRIYTKTVVNPSKITRPTFDHWFSKSDYPLLALSFYNLIPSCTVCNSGVKGTNPFKLDTHFHPYHKSIEEIDFKFSYDHKDYSSFKFKIINNNVFSKNSTKAFKLKEIYETHEDEITDLRRLRDIYSEKYLQMLKNNILKATSTSDEEIYRLAFGTHIDEAMFDRRPLSKMKKDILEELGILKHIK
ncbi:hypothetical protein [Flavobacterium agrisoli]|uniref:HNH endonuclease n=1 Tax=Flavobacterium agrisoli TaxID=2793066 RepID=A0A934UKJ5_9FLAO|nr:hypothetical protein [Flavobacterium agrisoli]MBK0371161.1 hypothetical protein [Flavobacterium agrisoli]